MSLNHKIQRILSRDKLTRKIYAVREGAFKGYFFVYISKTDEDYNFLALPENEAVSVPIQEFESGIKNKIVDYIEKLPHNVYEICCAQYNESKAKSDINRLKQSTTQSGMDSRKRKNKRKS